MITWMAKLNPDAAPMAPATCVATGLDPAMEAAKKGWENWRVITDEEAAELQRPTPEEEQAAQQQAFAAAIQQRLDAFAQTRNYDNIMSAATYATSTVPKFQAEGQYAVEARDATWATGYEIMNAVLAGEREMPTLEEVFAELPVLEWPEVAA